MTATKPILEQLAAVRRSRNWTIAEAANRLGVCPATVSQWESGNRAMTLARLQAYAGLLGFTVNLVRDESTPDEPNVTVGERINLYIFPNGYQVTVRYTPNTSPTMRVTPTPSFARSDFLELTEADIACRIDRIAKLPDLVDRSTT